MVLNSSAGAGWRGGINFPFQKSISSRLAFVFTTDGDWSINEQPPRAEDVTCCWSLLLAPRSRPTPGVGFSQGSNTRSHGSLTYSTRFLADAPTNVVTRTHAHEHSNSKLAKGTYRASCLSPYCFSHFISLSYLRVTYFILGLTYSMHESWSISCWICSQAMLNELIKSGPLQYISIICVDKLYYC